MTAIRSTLVRAGVAVTTAGLCLPTGALGASAVAGPDAPAAAAAGTTRASISLAGPSSNVTYGTTVQFIGMAWRTTTTTKLVNATVWLQRATHGGNTWTNVTSTHTSSTGAFAFNVKVTTPYDYRARYGGSATYTVAVSQRVFPIVRQNVLFDSIRDVSWELGTMQVGGRIYPAPAKGTRIWLQRYNTTSKAWSNFMSTVSTGTNAFLMKGNFSGNVGTYRIYAPQHGYYALNYSRQVTFAHYKWRGAFTKSIVASAGDYYIYTPSESPARNAMELHTAPAPAGPAYVDVNTAGCKSTTVGALNFTNQSNLTDATERVRVLNGSTHLRGPWTLAAGQDNFGSASLPNIASMRVQLEPVSTNADAYAYFEVRLLCTN